MQHTTPLVSKQTLAAFYNILIEDETTAATLQQFHQSGVELSTTSWTVVSLLLHLVQSCRDTYMRQSNTSSLEATAQPATVAMVQTVRDGK